MRILGIMAGSENGLDGAAERPTALRGGDAEEAVAILLRDNLLLGDGSQDNAGLSSGEKSKQSSDDGECLHFDCGVVWCDGVKNSGG